jgi:ABC-2 type transport system permease protein
MSTATLAAPAAARDVRPSLARLTAVELRKMTDTRAGFWLLLGVAALTAVAVALFGIFGDGAEHRLRDFLAVAIAPGAILLPVVGILLVSSEWSQRTAMLTFALVPERSRVLAAKVGAGVALALIALSVALPVAMVGTAAVGGEWTLPAWFAGQAAFYVITAMIGGIAFGAMLQSSAPAIVLYFVLPAAWSALGSLPFLEGAARWLDSARTLSPLTEELMSTTQWARVGTTLAVWMLLPLLIGLWRLTREGVR